MARENDAMSRVERIADYADRLTDELDEEKEGIDPVSPDEDRGVHAYDVGLQEGLDMAVSVVREAAREADVDMRPVEFFDHMSDELVAEIDSVDVPETRGRTQADEVKYERRSGVVDGLRLANKLAIDTPLAKDK